MWPGCGRMPERERPKPGWRKPRGLSQSLERNEEEENRGRARTPRGGCPPTSCRAVLPEQAWQRTPRLQTELQTGMDREAVAPAPKASG